MTGDARSPPELLSQEYPSRVDQEHDDFLLTQAEQDLTQQEEGGMLDAHNSQVKCVSTVDPGFTVSFFHFQISSSPPPDPSKQRRAQRHGLR